jgi:hypothetical protein
MNRLTVALATYRDFDGVYFTLQSLRAHHGTGFDILVLDNAPERCIRTEQVTRAVGGTYYHRPDLNGTSKSRDALFHLAQTPWVMVCDSHVLFEPGAIARLIGLSHEHPRDFLTGPLIHDDGKGISTHWRPTTPPGLWGVWDFDHLAIESKPFDIPMQGLGCFAMAREAWPGFHPLSRGFGGEEGYIHEKVRRAGGRVLCVPQLRWRHRFRDVGGFDKNPTPYAALSADHAFNLLIQHRELGIDAEAAIYQDFGNPQKMQPQEWTRALEQAKAVQPFGEPAKLPERQRIVGVWYTDNSAPAPLLANSLRSIEVAAKQAWRHDVEIVACGWEKPDGLPRGMTFVRFEGERKRSHATIVKQINEALDAGPIMDVVSFLEHDVLYPQDYFQKVGDAFAGNPTAAVVSNLDYIGLNAQGWQPVKERHEPMHQLSMRWAFAIENMERASKEAESGSALLEPQGDRSNWVRLPASPGLGLMPAVHVNHNAGRFTSHGDVCYAPAISTNHSHWGEHRNFWPHQEQAMAKSGCGVCNKGQASAQPQHKNLSEWYEAAKKNPCDFHEHVDTLRDLVKKCDHVTQIGIWGKPSRVAIAVGTLSNVGNAVFVDYSPAQRPEWTDLKRFLGDNFEGKEWQPFAEIDETDLLFIDTYHTAEETLNLFNKLAPKVRKYLVVHTTEIYGEKGDNGGPGVLVGVRQFVHENREWTVIRQDRNNYGLVVLSRLDEDRKTPPGALRKALNFSKALIAHAKAGQKLVDDATYESRLDTCLLCPDRAHDTCTKCGCPIDKKASWAEQQCPADPPRWPLVLI